MGTTRLNVSTFDGAQDAAIEWSSSVWDVRAFKKPLATHNGVTTLYPQTNAIFSPDEKFVLTGSGATIKGQRGKLIFLKRDTLEVEQEIDMDNTVVKVVWHSKINQVRWRCGMK